MILCFEGPSGIGKTSLCGLFGEDYAVVPEVNVLFEGQRREGKYWYHDRQADRFQIASHARRAILDGDPFQALWYNWTYGFSTENLSLEDLLVYYRRAIRQGQLRFPDRYFIFHTSREKLWERKENDSSRQRRNFEKHLALVQTFPAYFGHLASIAADRVTFVEYDEMAEAFSLVQEEMEQMQRIKQAECIEILEQMGDWLSISERSHFPA